jgi:hypothetical protein
MEWSGVTKDRAALVPFVDGFIDAGGLRANAGAIAAVDRLVHHQLGGSAKRAGVGFLHGFLS